MDVMDRMLELARQGYFCAQILLELALEMEGKASPELVRAMGGLNGGVGDSGGLCGAYTGGVCLLSYFAGKGEEDELPHPELQTMEDEFEQWFGQYSAEYGGRDCRLILQGDQRNKIQRCPIIVRDVFEKCMELLERHGAL